MTGPRVTVVINTYNRAESLRVTLEALRRLDGEPFEVVVVNGPSTDATEQVLLEYAATIKQGRCAHRNLSESRNLGIALAAGEVVAFIDDDAYPDPTWLERLRAGYDAPEVAGVGGPAFDHTGAVIQARYSVANRFGGARTVDDVNPTELMQHPDGLEFGYTIGTNSSFRRRHLVAVGGFDEEFEYYLDETDVCRRLLDRGLLIRAVDDAFVYHKFLSSEVRTSARAIRDRSNVLKSTAYFALKHGLRWGSFADVCRHLAAAVEAHRSDYRWCIDHGLLTASDLEQFERDVHTAFDIALARHRTAGSRERPPEFFATPPPFVAYPRRLPAGGRLRLCFITQEWPPQPLNGIARVIHTLSNGLAEAGHTVDVLTRGEHQDRVDLEGGVWVHRMVVRGHPQPSEVDVPQRIWDHAATMHDELLRLEAMRHVDLVQIPNWDAEGIAVLLAGGFTTSLGLYTPIATVRQVDPRLVGESRELDQLAAIERLSYQRADLLLACGPAIVEEVSARYHLELDAERIGYAAHGLPDVPRAVTPAGGPEITVLFVGRLEPRKGIDTLLECIPELAGEFPLAHFVIAGNDTLPSEHGPTYRRQFETSLAGRMLGDRVRFLGMVDDAELTRLYAACDVFVAPSRYESFGLILVEAMRQGRPVVAGDVGGMREIVAEGETGLLVPPGDATALRRALAGLLASEPVRRRMGERARRRYLEHFTAEGMVATVAAHYRRVVDARAAADGPEPPPAPRRTVAIPLAVATAGIQDGAPEASTAVPAPSPASAVPPAATPPFACPVCRTRLRPAPRVVTADGRLKEGHLVCDTCHAAVARVEQFKVDFRVPHGPPPDGWPVVVPVLGERRLAAAGPGLSRQGGWSRHDSIPGALRAVGEAELTVTGQFTDAVVRLLTCPGGGAVDIQVDDGEVMRADLSVERGEVVLPVAAASDLPFTEHRLRLRPVPDGAVTPGLVVVEEIVLRGPLGAVTGYGPPPPVNRGNPYGPELERHIAQAAEADWILEIGGGDRRRADPRHVNFEYLKFELADVYGDIQSLPFPDDSFGLVFSQAVFEHVANPFEAAQELIRVTRPGGLIVTEAAFMQPLHAVPYHYFNMTPWGAEELFKTCDIVTTGWFGGLSLTVESLMRSVSLDTRLPEDEFRAAVNAIARHDHLVSHQDLRAAAAGIYLVARKPG